MFGGCECPFTYTLARAGVPGRGKAHGEGAERQSGGTHLDSGCFAVGKVKRVTLAKKSEWRCRSDGNRY